MYRPLGITILSILYVLGGVVGVIAAVMFGMFSVIMSNSMMDEFAVLGGAISGIFVGVAILEFTIAGCLLAAKKWARKIVIIFVVIDLVLEFFSIFGGNAFAVALIVLDLFVLYYLYRPHVIEYFGENKLKTCVNCGFIARDNIELHNHKIICEKNKVE